MNTFAPALNHNLTFTTPQMQTVLLSTLKGDLARKSFQKNLSQALNR
jgi:hypothetical protein